MSIADKDLHELTKLVFSEKYDYLDEQKKIKGRSGRIWTFDGLVKNANSLFGIFIRDWKRESHCETEYIGPRNDIISI